jgi:hypothetical protein
MLGQSLFAWREEKKASTVIAETEYQPYKRYVEKQRLPVMICMNNYRVEGMLHITYHHRALDVLNGPETFVPITSARIFNSATNEMIAELDFIAITKRQIVLFYETGDPLPPLAKELEEYAEDSPPAAAPADEGAKKSGVSPDGATPQ